MMLCVLVIAYVRPVGVQKQKRSISASYFKRVMVSYRLGLGLHLGLELRLEWKVLLLAVVMLCAFSRFGPSRDCPWSVSRWRDCAICASLRNHLEIGWYCYVSTISYHVHGSAVYSQIR